MLSSYMFMLLQRHVKMAYRIRTKQGSTVVVSVLHVLTQYHGLFCSVRRCQRISPSSNGFIMEILLKTIITAS